MKKNNYTGASLPAGFDSLLDFAPLAINIKSKQVQLLVKVDGKIFKTGNVLIMAMRPASVTVLIVFYYCCFEQIYL